MSEESPKKPRRRSGYACSVDTVLVRITAKPLPHDSEEFRERERRARERHRPPEEPKPDENPPAA